MSLAAPSSLMLAYRQREMNNPTAGGRRGNHGIKSRTTKNCGRGVRIAVGMAVTLGSAPLRMQEQRLIDRAEVRGTLGYLVGKTRSQTRYVDNAGGVSIGAIK